MEEDEDDFLYGQPAPPTGPSAQNINISLPISPTLQTQTQHLSPQAPVASPSQVLPPGLSPLPSTPTAPSRTTDPTEANMPGRDDVRMRGGEPDGELEEGEEEEQEEVEEEEESSESVSGTSALCNYGQ